MASEEFSGTLFPLFNEANDDKDHQDIMSPQLRSNFKQLKAYLSPQEEFISEKKRENRDCCENDKKKRKQSNNEKERELCTNKPSSEHIMGLSCDNLGIDLNKMDKLLAERVCLAAHTLVSAENEIAMLEKGIVELESLLDLNEENNVTNNRANENIEDSSRLGTSPPMKASNVNQDLRFDIGGQTIIQAQDPLIILKMGEK